MLFCVDASGSMAARKRMTQVKTAVLSLLMDAYRRRDKVGLITFRGQGAELALPPTHSVEIAAARLDELPAGGRTPLAAGLLEAAKVLQRERLRDPRLRPLLVVVTDGRATDGADAVGRSVRAAEYVAGLRVTTVVIDSEGGPLRLGLAVRLAEVLGAEHLPVAEVDRRGAGRHRPQSHRAQRLHEGGGLMPQGRPIAVPDDGLTTRQRRNRPLVMVHTGDGKGKSTAAFGLAPAGLEPGLADRGLPVREVRQVAHRRAGRARTPRPAARRDRRRRAGRVAQDGVGLVLDPQARRRPTTTRPPPSRAGRRSSAASPPRPTTC